MARDWEVETVEQSFTVPFRGNPVGVELATISDNRELDEGEYRRPPVQELRLTLTNGQVVKVTEEFGVASAGLPGDYGALYLELPHNGLKIRLGIPTDPVLDGAYTEVAIGAVEVNHFPDGTTTVCVDPVDDDNGMQCVYRDAVCPHCGEARWEYRDPQDGGTRWGTGGPECPCIEASGEPAAAGQTSTQQ